MQTHLATPDSEATMSARRIGLSRLGLVIVLALGGALACASTRVETRWKDPALDTEALAFRKLIVLAQLEDEGLRRAAEDEIVRVVSTSPRARAYGTEVVPAYRWIPTSALGDVPGMQATVEAAGFDGAVVLQLVSDEERVRYHPGSYQVWWGYSVGPYDPGYTTRTRIVRVETRLYSVAEKKLLWAGVTRTINPQDVVELVDEIARAVGEELEAQGASR
jgi:hypothetical protein